MEITQPAISTESAVMRCTGGADDPHQPLDLAFSGKPVVTCPRCGRRFVRAGWAGSISPAAWPKND